MSPMQEAIIKWLALNLADYPYFLALWLSKLASNPTWACRFHKWRLPKHRGTAHLLSMAR